MTTPPTAKQKRAAHPDFTATFSLAALRQQLPLTFTAHSDISPSPKRKYRSAYRYHRHVDLADPARLATMSHFEVALRVVDFASLRDRLAQHYAPTARGQAPFDPVSLFLALCLRRDLNLSWRALAQLLASPHGAEWRRLFGFHAGQTPSASGLRYFQNAVGQTVFADLCALFFDLIRHAGLAPEHSTFPGDPPTRGVSLSYDGMLHEARSRMRCPRVAATCYQSAPRTCRAERAGCACDTDACAAHCRLATPRDAEARLVHYSGRNKHADVRPGPPAKGRNVYGYHSDPIRLLDDRFACAWTLGTGLHPANTSERNLLPKRLAWVRARFPDLAVGEVLADAAFGFDDCLSAIWALGALRMIDIRAAHGEEDRDVQLQRGYDAHGHPVCIHGFTMHPNGRDSERRRTKWCCRHACRRQGHNTAVPDCPYLSPEHKHGQVVNVGRTMPDGSPRLARDIPYGSRAWRARYGRRSLSESRNGVLERLGLKRLPCHGRARAFKEVTTADFLDNLNTLGRLVRQATTLAATTTAA
jgi:hypothetical protein